MLNNIEWYQYNPFDHPLMVHSLSKVLFAFFGLALANENGQDHFFFFEDIR